MGTVTRQTTNGTQKLNTAAHFAYGVDANLAGGFVGALSGMEGIVGSSTKPTIRNRAFYGNPQIGPTEAQVVKSAWMNARIRFSQLRMMMTGGPA
jgi:hypothetical protein